MALQIVRFLRVKDWFYFLFLPLLSVNLLDLTVAPLVLGVLVGAGGLGFAYGWNNIKDAGSDFSTRKNPLAGGRARAGGPSWPVVLAVVVVATVGLAALAGWTTLIAAAVQLIASALYSGGPRLKGIPVAGTLTNVLIFAPLCFMGRIAHPGELPGFAWFVVLFAAVLVQNQMVHEVGDSEEDRREGLRTTAIAFGPRVTLTGAAVLGLCAYGLLVAIGSTAARTWVLAGIGLPLLLFSLEIARTGQQGGGRRAATLRVRHRWLGLAVCALAWIAFQWGALVSLF